MAVTIYTGDCRDVLKAMPDQSVHCVVTSPPYFGLRDYGMDAQIGMEPTPDEFVAALVGVLREARRVLRGDGTLWLNLGDSYAGSGRGIGDTKTNNKGQTASRDFHDSMVEAGAIGRAWVKPPAGFKQKDLIGIPWRVAFALQTDGWYLRQDIIWHKPNPMPESVRDRCTKAHEYLFLLSKSPTYYFDWQAMQEPATNRPPGNKRPTKGGREYAEAEGEHHRTAANLHNIEARETRNRRSVWTVATKPFKEAHFATFPVELVEPCILAGCAEGGTVLDPFGGAGTTGLVAARLQRHAALIELNPAYAALARSRIDADAPLMAGAA